MGDVMIHYLPGLHADIFSLIKYYSVEIASTVMFLVYLARAVWHEISGKPRANKRRRLCYPLLMAKEANEDILSREALTNLQRKLSMMSVTALQDFYRSAHVRCQFTNNRLPPAHFIQELVQAWKQMRKWK
jgi:hypothetical protein